MQLGETVELFPTPVYIGYMSEETHNATLEKIKDMEWGKVPLSNKAHDMNVSVQYGEPVFHSDVISEYDLSEFNEELGHHCNAYCQHTGQAFGSFFRQSWITRYHKGDYAEQHSHGSSSISIAYYLSTNGDDGHFYVMSPTPAKITATTEFLGSRYKIQPEERKLLLFPSWLEHGVEKNTTDSTRMCLSANLIYDYKDR